MCGLKHDNDGNSLLDIVTPCVGVWIETSLMLTLEMASAVTPCVGVWIETIRIERYGSPYFVTPCVGVWIETLANYLSLPQEIVTPCVGVWIETRYSLYREGERGSHPAWVCGLKLHYPHQKR